MTQTLAKPSTPQEFITQGCERPWEVAVEPFRVAPHVYYVGNAWVGSYLIETEAGLILLDATMHSQVYLVFESIRKLGFDPRNIKILLLSHGHYDHCGGVRPIIEYTGAKLYMGKEDAYFLTERQDLILTEGYEFGTFKADQYYDDNEPIMFGDVIIHTQHTPGHTPGTTSFFFDDKDDAGNCYHCGLHGGLGVNTMVDDLITEAGWPISIREMFLDDLIKLKRRKVDIALGSHPNHVQMFEKIDRITETCNPFVDQTAWPKLMDERIAMIKKIIEESKLSTQQG